MRRTKRMSLMALLLALALVAAACGGDDGGDTGDTGDTGGATGGTFSVGICEPQFLQPGNTQETCGSQVLQALFDPLVEFDPETAEPFNDVAESIESEDLQTWTVKIKEGYTWHNGEPLVAQNYVDAWNWAANAKNKALNSYFFANIEGYDDLNPEKGDPKTDEMSGLSVVDDTTFEVTLSEPFSQFPLTVGYGAFYPLPEAFFDDPDAYNQKPIGQGPYEMDGKWKHDQEINVTKFADYAGEEPNADAIEFRIYADLNTAYVDLIAGDLDITDTIPTENLAQAPSELGERFISVPSSYFGYIGFPMYQEPWDKLELRQAMSMAMDREAITTAIFQGTYQPAKSIIAPVVPGFREDACGAVCEFNPEEAKRLWDENGGPDEVTLWFNNDGGHEEWMEAYSNQVRDALGVKVKFESLAFEEYLTLQEEEKITGPYRGAWVFDYPSPQNYLEPIFGCEGSSQEFGYEEHGCEEAQELIDQANATEDLDAAIALYQQAEDKILEDLPAFPTWFGVTNAGHSENVTNVIVDVFSFVRLDDVEVVGGGSA
ncbi:MAG: ABC transporter substrate-binding protein [Actinomycetota bacterium]|nr:ABC transporter substrate-binding protein [Actinomycetota bacterium]